MGRWMGDALASAVTVERWDAGAVVAGGAGADLLKAYGGDAEVMGGKGDDSIGIGGDNSVIRYDRGDGRDEVQGWGSGHTIAFGAGIDAADVRLRIKPSGQVAVGIAGSEGDEILLPIWKSELGYADFLSGLRFADGSTLSWAALLAAGLDIEADAGDTVVTGTQHDDRFADAPDGAVLQGREGQDA